MKPSEFYEQYWHSQGLNGEKLYRRKLSEEEKDFIDKAVLDPNSFVSIITRRRERSIEINLESIRNAMDNLNQQNNG